MVNTFLRRLDFRFSRDTLHRILSQSNIPWTLIYRNIHVFFRYSFRPLVLNRFLNTWLRFGFDVYVRIIFNKKNSTRALIAVNINSTLVFAFCELYKRCVFTLVRVNVCEEVLKHFWRSCSCRCRLAIKLTAIKRR